MVIAIDGHRPCGVSESTAARPGTPTMSPSGSSTWERLDLSRSERTIRQSSCSGTASCSAERFAEFCPIGATFRRHHTALRLNLCPNERDDENHQQCRGQIIRNCPPGDLAEHDYADDQKHAPLSLFHSGGCVPEAPGLLHPSPDRPGCRSGPASGRRTVAETILTMITAAVNVFNPAPWIDDQAVGEVGGDRVHIIRRHEITAMQGSRGPAGVVERQPAARRLASYRRRHVLCVISTN